MSIVATTRRHHDPGAPFANAARLAHDNLAILREAVWLTEQADRRWQQLEANRREQVLILDECISAVEERDDAPHR